MEFSPDTTRLIAAVLETRRHSQQAYRSCQGILGLGKRYTNARLEANARICFTYWRTVAKDHTISLFGRVLSLPKLLARLNLVGRRVELRHRMDGRLAVVYRGQVLGLLQPAKLAPPFLDVFVPASQHLAPQIPKAAEQTHTSIYGSGTRPSRTQTKPDYDHPWRRQGRAAHRRRQQLKEQNQKQDQ